MKYLNKNFWLHQLDVILKRPQAKNGFINYVPSGTDEIHVAGKNQILGYTKEVLQARSDWRTCRPIGEEQARDGSETMSCVTHSALNAIEEIVLRLNEMVINGEANDEQREIVNVFKHFGILKLVNGRWNANSSDRFIAMLSGTSYRGNTQKNVADAIRKNGLIPDELWPFVSGWNNYYTYPPQELINRGKRLLDYIDFTYEFSAPKLLADSLKYAPCQSSVYAWNGRDANGVYIATSAPLNHAILRDYVDDKYVYIFDSYDTNGDFEKRTYKNFNFGYDLLFTIHLKKPLDNFNTTAINELQGRGFKYVMRTDVLNGAAGEVYELKNGQLIELSTQDKLNTAIKDLASRKDLTGISEELYKKLVNLL